MQVGRKEVKRIIVCFLYFYMGGLGVFHTSTRWIQPCDAYTVRLCIQLLGVDNQSGFVLSYNRIIPYKSV